MDARIVIYGGGFLLIALHVLLMNIAINRNRQAKCAKCKCSLYHSGVVTLNIGRRQLQYCQNCAKKIKTRDRIFWFVLFLILLGFPLVYYLDNYVWKI